jgi:hypothetical protein
MFSLRCAALIAALLQHTIAQQSNIVPEDLRGGFTSKDTEVQVSYTNEAVNGFKDGTLFSKDGENPFADTSNNIDLHAVAVSKEPTFALGDSSGISPTVLYTIIMVDTTCSNKRVLHYARSNFKNNFDITNINTTTAPLLDYKAPGSFAETGDNRQYSFLMYINPQRKQIDSLKMPAEGEAFDAKKFQTDNGLQDPTAGVGMVVKLGGQADCGGDQPNGIPDALPSPRPSRSTATNAQQTSPAAGSSSNAQVVPTSTSVSQGGTSEAARTTPVPGNGSNDTLASSRPLSSGLVTAPSGGLSGGPVTSTLVLSSAGPDGAVGASGTPSASPAQQTTNAAPVVFADGERLLTSLLVVIGLAMW